MASLIDQASVAVPLKPDIIEWRADFFREATADVLRDAARELRTQVGDTPVIFTLRAKNEGGVRDLDQPQRRERIEAVLRTGLVDIVDLELANEQPFLDALMAVARSCDTRVLLAMHNFTGTPDNDVLMDHIRAMKARGADIAKIAVMPTTADDALSMLQLAARARREFPELPLSLMSMGALGSITRVAGFLYGSDMAFAVGKTASAPGQIPIEDARRAADLLLRYS